MRTITFCGQEIALTDEQIAAIRAWMDEPEQEPEPEKKSPFKRLGHRGLYYCVSGNGEVDSDHDDMTYTDDSYFNAANYCTDRTLMEQRAMHETLNRLLWRYREEHDGDSPLCSDEQHFFIYKEGNEIGVGCHHACKAEGTIYFQNSGTANAAIHQVVEPFLAEHPGFAW